VTADYPRVTPKGRVADLQAYRKGCRGQVTRPLRLGRNGGGPMLMQVLVDGKGSGDYMAGNVFTPTFVQSQWSTAQSASNGRRDNSAVMQQPGLVIS
jgi:hypothetical protein